MKTTDKEKQRWMNETMIVVSKDTSDRLRMKALKAKVSRKKLLEMFSKEK